MRKLFLFASAFSAAVFAANQLSSGWLPWFALAFGGLFALCAALWRTAKKPIGVFGAPNRLRAALLFCGAVFGFLWMWGYTLLFYAPAEQLIGKTETVSATVLNYSETTTYGFKALVRVSWGDARIQTLFYGDSTEQTLEPGDELTLTAAFVSAKQSHGESVTWYTAKGIFLIAYQSGTLSVQKPEHLPLWTLPAVTMERLEDSISLLFSGTCGALVQAVVTGNLDGLTDADTTALSRTGLIHTVSVSGMHVSFLVGVLTLLLGRRRRRTALLCIPLILFFMAAAGNTPSIMRAAFMQILLLIAPLLRREYDPPTGLAFVLMLVLLQNPFAANHVSLQLSFASVAGILLFSQRIYDALEEKLISKAQTLPRRLANGGLRVLISSLSASLGAMVFTTPIVAFYFQSVSLVAPLSNLLTLWALSLLFLGGLLAAVLGLLWLPLGIAAALPVSLAGAYLEVIIPLLSRFSFASVSMESFYDRAWLVFLYAILLLWLILGRARPLIPLCMAAVTLCLCLALTRISMTNPSLTVSVLDVGQGESIALLSGGNTALVDCGGNGLTDAGDVAANYIQNLGTSTLNVLILTHFHTDHANGVEELFQRLTVENVILPQTEEDSDLKEDILALCGEEGTTITYLSENMTLPFGDSTLTLYAPLGTGETNEEGLSILCTSGDYDVLMTGDMGSDVEARLIKYDHLPDIELLVAGHHGSRYSTSDALLDAVKPEVAVISVGYNSYGHPSEETLARLESRGIAIYRTDLMGTVTIQAG
ncbi:MAG: internalization-related competence protein ComEC/Rec2 [Oscillospiraceae bacterium]|nr:internalization-related competence protein ComEC/Rec2 [Oscillospiraceae bacterium]